MARIGQVTVLVRDYDEAIRWWVDAAGFELVADTPLGEGKRWVVVRPSGAGAADGAALVLAVADTETQRARVGDQLGGRVGLFLLSDDFVADHARMVAGGVRFREEPRHEPYGTVAVFEDLYGNTWDLIQPAG